MKLIFSLQAPTGTEIIVYEHDYIPAPFTFAVFANSYTSKNLPILPPSPSFSINCTYFADTPVNCFKHSQDL